MSESVATGHRPGVWEQCSGPARSMLELTAAFWRTSYPARRICQIPDLPGFSQDERERVVGWLRQQAGRRQRPGRIAIWQMMPGDRLSSELLASAHQLPGWLRSELRSAGEKVVDLVVGRWLVRITRQGCRVVDVIAA